MPKKNNNDDKTALDDVLPPILSLIDDHDEGKVLQGLEQLLECLLEKYSPEEFLRRNWALVVYDALNKIIYLKSSNIIGLLGVGLLKVLSMVEVDPNENCDKLTKYDTTIQKIIFAMECSNDNNLKRVWLKHLMAFIDQMGHASLHFSDKIDALLHQFVNGSTDKELWLAVLRCVHCLIKNTWIKPASKTKVKIILKILFNQGVTAAVEDLQSKDDSIDDDIVQEVKECFELMKYCEDYEEVKIDVTNSTKLMEKERNTNLYKDQVLIQLEKCGVKEFI